MQIKYSDIGTEPVTLAEAKAWLKIDFSDEDTLITSLITQMRQRVEEFTGLSVVSKTIEYFDEEICDEVLLPYPEHDDITEVKVNGVVTTDYSKTGLNQFIIRPNSVTTTDSENDQGLYVKYTAGSANNHTELVKHAILKSLAEQYRHRGNTFVGAIAELSESALVQLMQIAIV